MAKQQIQYINIDGIMVARCFDDIDREAEKLGKYLGNRNTHRTNQAIDYSENELSKLFD